MTQPKPSPDSVDPEDGAITSPPAKTAGEQDHSDPTVFVGEDADPPGND